MRIAIIGSGIAGLSASWLLRDHADITLYEKADRLGGHTHTVTVELAHAPQPISVDTGFIVYNLATYPNFIAFLKALDVKTQPSDMSFALSMDRGAYEYAGDSLLKLIGHPANLFRPTHWRMVIDLLRFMRNGEALARCPDHVTLGDYLDQHHYGDAFKDYHILPVAAAIWSASPEEILNFPARSFGQFFKNHGLLEPRTDRRPQWRTISGGSQSYIDKITASHHGEIILNSKIKYVDTANDLPRIYFADGAHEEFDHIIIASHADEALKLLPNAGPEYRKYLGAFHYSTNTTYLHQDERLMPKRISLWSSWNYLRMSTASKRAQVFVTYWMNRLQSIDQRYPLFVSLNPPAPPREDKILKQMVYHHPQFTLAALEAQEKLKQIQGRHNIWFCGSYFGYGFHEDGLASATAVAEALGAPAPWDIVNSSPAYDNAVPVHHG